MQSYRVILEVLKWVETKTILQTASLADTLWHSAASSEELWTSFLEALPADALQHIPNAQDRYRAFADLQHTPRLVSRLHSQLNVFNCGTCSFEQVLPFPHLFNNRAAAALSTYQLYICGKGKAVMLSFLTGILTQLPDMLASRKNHSAIALHGSVYAFGGSNLRSAERYHDDHWAQLPNMSNERSYFNACSQDERIYLCGGFTSFSEVFDASSNTYTVLPFSLISHWTTSFFSEEGLVCIANGVVSHISKDYSVTIASKQPAFP
jgi:hypothetical protein